MTLKEIQDTAERLRKRYDTGTMGLDYDVWSLAILVRELATRIQEHAETPVYVFECDALKLVKEETDPVMGMTASEAVQEADARAREVEEKALVSEAFEQMKPHYVTVEYQATHDLNDLIIEKITDFLGIPGKNPVPFIYPTVSLDYILITSDDQDVV